MGVYSGAGVIFGATGGVMEAALRSAYYSAQRPQPQTGGLPRRAGDATGAAGWTEAEFDLGGGAVVRTAVVSGLANTGRLLAELQAGRVHYDFVEVMACPGGCAGGGGQPIHTDDVERAAQRGKVLYNIDRIQTVRFSHENPEVSALYRDDLGQPGSEQAEALLHTDHNGWQMPAQS